MTYLNFTSGNPSLAKVALFSVSKQWVNLCVRHLPEDQQAEALNMFAAINPEVFNQIEDTQMIQIASLRYQDGAFKKTYPMSLQSYKGGFAVKFGREIAPLSLENMNDLMGEFKNVKLENYGEPSLVLTLENKDDSLTTLALPLRLNNDAWQANREDSEMFLQKLRLAAKKGNFDKIASMLVEATPNGGGDDRLPVIKITELPELEEISIVSFKEVDISGRQAFVLTVRHNDADCNVWAPSSIRKMLDLGAVVTPTTTMMYRTYLNRAGKSCVEAKLMNYDLPQDDSNLMDLFM